MRQGQDVRHLVVAVDGPAGSGKSTAARGTARRLGLRYLDTGAMYRALTWWMLQARIDLENAAAVAQVVDEPVLDVGTDPDVRTVTVDGVDVTTAIRTREVGNAVSAVSAVPEVRRRLLALQRELIGAGGIVVEGRDIGTVVAPDAQVKVFLTAAPAERARRRTGELPAEAKVTVDHTHADLVRRDRLDSSRATSPLAQADDAVLLDTTDLGPDEVVDRICGLTGRVAPRQAQEQRT